MYAFDGLARGLSSCEWKGTPGRYSLAARAGEAMRIEEMSAVECREFLRRTDVGRLGCVSDGVPYVVPIHFAYEPDRIYGFTTLGQKVRAMRTNPRVCVEVDDVAGTRSWCSVIAHGLFKELPNEPPYAQARERAFKLLEKQFMWWETAFAAEQPRHSSRPADTILYCIEIESMSGRCAKRDVFDAKPKQQAAGLGY